jgi:hypothetical protein
MPREHLVVLREMLGISRRAISTILECPETCWCPSDTFEGRFAMLERLPVAYHGLSMLTHEITPARARETLQRMSRGTT